MNGRTRSRSCRKTYPHHRTVVLASRNDAELATAAIQGGAKGYIPVTMGFDIAVQAIRFVLAGGTYAPIDYSTFGKSIITGPIPSVSVLTSREASILEAIRQGKSNKNIAFDLSMSESTVKVHVRNIFKKLNVK